MLVSDGLLTRAAYAALTVPTVARDQVPEILAILEFVEGLALDSALDSTPDLRGLRESAGASVWMALHALVAAAASGRLTWIHRRTSFELVLATHAHSGLAEPDASHDVLVRAMSEALFRQDRPAALAALLKVQSQRRSALGALAVPAAAEATSGARPHVP